MTESAGHHRLGQIVFYGGVVLLAWLAYRVFEPFLTPLAWAGVFVVSFYPWHARLEKKWGASRAAAVSTVAITLMLIVPAIVILSAFVNEATEAARAFRQGGGAALLGKIQQVWTWLQQKFPQVGHVDLVSLGEQAAQKMGAFLAAQVGALLRNVAVFLFDLIVVILAMFYLFRDAPAMIEWARRLLPFDEAERGLVLEQTRNLIQASVTSGLIVAAVQGFLGGAAFALVGVGGPVFWGVVMVFFSLLPIVGAWIVWVPAALWLLASGKTVAALVLTIIGAGVIGTVDNVLRPWLMAGRSQMSGLLMFISLLGGISVFGMVGVVLGPIVVATGVTLLQNYAQRQTAARVRGAVLE
jgi:predicted PurR-regulated permease PerM